jgi:hypothetical protein
LALNFLPHPKAPEQRRTPGRFAVRESSANASRLGLRWPSTAFPERQRRGIFVDSVRTHSQAPQERHIPAMSLRWSFGNYLFASYKDFAPMVLIALSASLRTF